MAKFTDLIEFRTKKLDGVEDENWLWPKSDKGAYAGPFSDWNTSHKDKYFKNVKEKRLIITAGANMGIHVRAYASMFNYVYAFEPHWLNFYCMSYNCPYDNVFKFQMALGDKIKRSYINENKNNMGANRINETAADQHKMLPMITIDSLDLPYCDMIQLDVEGYESKILKGAEKTIKKYKPVIVIEGNHHEAADILNSNKYVLQDKSFSDYIYYVP